MSSRLKSNMISSIRRLASVAVVVSLVSVTGCSLCCSPYDYQYGTYGTRTPRVDMTNGRVGSTFSDPSLISVQQQPITTEYESSDAGVIVDESVGAYGDYDVVEDGVIEG